MGIQHKIHFVSLSTSDFFWIVSTDWDIEYQSFFAENRPARGLNLFNPPSFSKISKKAKLITSQWVLTDSSRQFKGWAEVQVNQSSFCSALLFFGGEAFEKKEYPFTSQAVSLLISSLFILAEADSLTLVLGKNAQIFSFADSWGSKKSLWSPPWKDLYSDKLVRVECIDIFPQEWWTKEVGKQNRETLKFLVVRRKRFAQAFKKSIFRDVWNRLFRR